MVESVSMPSGGKIWLGGLSSPTEGSPNDMTPGIGRYGDSAVPSSARVNPHSISFHSTIPFHHIAASFHSISNLQSPKKTLFLCRRVIFCAPRRNKLGIHIHISSQQRTLNPHVPCLSIHQCHQCPSAWALLEPLCQSVYCVGLVLRPVSGPPCETSRSRPPVSRRHSLPRQKIRNWS